MSRRKKNAQRRTKGCRLCGNPGFGRGIKGHVEGKHDMDYKLYVRCFEKTGKTVLDELVQSGHTHGGQRIILHVWVRKFVV